MAEKVYQTLCPIGCHQYCALKVWVRDGVIAKVESADYPGDPQARGICLKGLASHRLVYHPDRLKYPLKRAGPRGSGQWQRISWDEALDEIAGKLLEVREKFGARSVMIVPGGSGSVGAISSRFMGVRFTNVWGATASFQRGLADGGPPASSAFILGQPSQGHVSKDYLNSRLIVLWGGNPAETAFREMRHIMEAQEKGARLVSISPVYDVTAAKADGWIPVRPGTDGALALGLMNVILERHLYDREYVLQHTVGPFLVREDTKKFLREKDIIPGGSARKYVVWDSQSQGYQVYDPHLGARIEESFTSHGSPEARVVWDGQKKRQPVSESAALLGRFEVRGVPCQPAFQFLVDRAKEYPLPRVAAITGLPVNVIENLALTYAHTRPAAIRVAYGMGRTYHANMNVRAIITLAAITGNIGVHGGGVTIQRGEYPIHFNYKAIASPPGAPGSATIPGHPNNSFRGWMAVGEGQPYPIKVLLHSCRNTILTYGNINSYLKIFSNLELIVASEIFMSTTARYADIVLPETTVFERPDIAVSQNYVVRMQQCIEPLYEAKSSFWFWSELGKRVGLGKYFNNTLQEFLELYLKSDDPSLRGITLERLDREGIVRANLPEEPPIPFPDRNFPTPSGKIEFYVEDLIPFGQELPEHREPLESPIGSPLAPKYPLTLFTRKTRIHKHSMCANVDWMLEIEPEPLLEINPADARKRDIATGDSVEVFNDRGKMQLKALLSEALPPGVVNTDHGWWPEHFASGHYNLLLHGVDDSSVINPVLETPKISGKAYMGSAHLPHYDCLVEVRKVPPLDPLRAKRSNLPISAQQVQEE